MGPGGCRGLSGASAVSGGGCPPVVSRGIGPQRSSPAIAAPSPSPAAGLTQMQRRRLAAPSFLPLAAALLLVSFLSHFWGWGGWRVRKCAQGRRPGGSVARSPAPLHTHPARDLRGVRDPGAEPRAVPEGLSRPRTPAPPARRPCACWV